VAIRYVRAVSFSLATVLALVACVIAFGYWRLTSGPIELDFLARRIEAGANTQLAGTHTRIGKAIIEIDKDSGAPSIRFVNLTLLDAVGGTIARIPKVGVELDFTDWLSGNVRPRSIDVYGARINAIRTFDGGLELGIADATNEKDPVNIDFGETNGSENLTSTKGNLDDPPESTSLPASDNVGKHLMDLLRSASSSPQLLSMNEIRIRQAQIRFDDEANQASWFAPAADMVISRTNDGFQMRTSGSISSSGAPWKASVAAVYSRQTGRVSVTAQVEDVIPSDVANKIYALSQFARFESPLAGRVIFDLDEQGTIQTGAAELVAGKGKLNLPAYLSRPITIDSGVLKLAYQSDNPAIKLVDSYIIVDGAQASLGGEFEPVRGKDGKLSEIKIKIDSNNTGKTSAIAAHDLIERVSFVGTASVETQRIDVEDLIVMNGQTGVRLRGLISGGEITPGLQLAGRLRDVDAELLKKLWPPIVTPNTRSWVQSNVIAGRISEGTFQVNFAPDALAQALKEYRFEPQSVSLHIKLADVESRYFKNLSPIKQGAGFADLVDNNFKLSIESGVVALGEEVIKLESGTFDAPNHLLPESQGIFQFKVSGTMAGLKSLLAQPDLIALNVKPDSILPTTGDVAARIHLDWRVSL
jgi:Protein of unknown function